MFLRRTLDLFSSSAMEDDSEGSPDLVLARMRRSMDNLGLSMQEFSDATLMRLLTVRLMDVEKAAKMLAKWREWRETLVPNGYVSESEVADELEARKIYLQGSAKCGWPLLIVKASWHCPSEDKLQFKTLSEDEKLVAILDRKDITYKNVDVCGLITGFQFLQSYYPERLVRCYIIHMPAFFVSVWRLVSRFHEKAMLEKIVILTTQEEHEDLTEQIGDALPEEYGGQAKLVANQDVTLSWSL